MKLLIVDIGGSNVKLWRPENAEGRKFSSGKRLTADEMVRRTRKRADAWEFDAVAMGIPCRVIRGRPVEEPENLGGGWVGFDFDHAFERPVRIMNDAALQALGSYNGGRMLFLGLGTGIGSALVDQHTVVSLDLGQLPHGGSQEIFELLSKAGLKKLGKTKWRQLVIDTTLKLRQITHADEVVLGGGQAKYLPDLPSGLRLGGNEQVIHGGVRLWNELPHPAEMDDQVWRII